MPAYELFLLIKNLPKPDLANSIKRTAEAILKKNGVIRSMENLGYKELPYRMKAHKEYHTTGNSRIRLRYLLIECTINQSYILLKFDLPGRDVYQLDNELSKDSDYIRTCVSSNHEYDENYKVPCKCEERGEFVKNKFDFERPMTVWDKKRIFNNYGRRL